MSFNTSINNNNVSISPSPGEKEKTNANAMAADTTNLGRPSSFNGDDDGFSLQDDLTHNNMGLSFGDKEEECNNSNHNHKATKSYSRFRIAPSSCSWCNNILVNSTAIILFLIAVFTGTRMTKSAGVGSSNEVAVVIEGGDGGNIVPGYDFAGGGGGLSSDRTLQVNTYNFIKAFDGECADSSTKKYDYMVDSNSANFPDAEACGNLCAICPGQNQQANRVLGGFLYRGDQCRCFLDDGPDVLDAFACNGFNGMLRGRSDFLGTGPICKSLGGVGECWKVVDSNSLCPGETKSPSPPSTAPTNSPSNSPTSPPSTAPTKSPSNSPTSPPSTAPTNSPSNSPTSPPSTSKAPTNASAKSGKNTKTNAANVGTKLQVQEMKSRGSSAFISPLVITLVSMMALDACFHLN